MSDKKEPDRRDEHGRREERGPSVFPKEGEKPGREERDPEEEGSREDRTPDGASTQSCRR